jgi:hypothetical protein
MTGLYGFMGHDGIMLRNFSLLALGALTCKCLASAAVADTLLADPTQRDALAACSAPRANFE